MNVLVFDIETIPDVDAGRSLYQLQDLTDERVAEVMRVRRQEKTGGSDFLAHHLHRVVAISLVLRHADTLKIWSLGDLDSDEQEIISRFFAGIDRYSPTLVSWNGGGFDLPVLHYRALIHGLSAPRYWDSGDDDREFRWNNYLNRFHSRHTDLMDVLAAYQVRAAVPLDELSMLLGFPGKMGVSGANVWQQYLDGQLQQIRDYCETDVLNTYLIYLRWEMLRGNLSKKDWAGECQLLRDTLARENKPHFEDFLGAWKDPG